MDIKARNLNFEKKKLLLVLIYNILVSDQDYADEEKYLFSNLVELIDVQFDYNKDMMIKSDIINQMKTLSDEELSIFLETVRLAIEADGKVTDDEITFFVDLYEALEYSESEIESKIDYLKYGETL